jgi:hypothetical protein
VSPDKKNIKIITKIEKQGEKSKNKNMYLKFSTQK